MKIEIVVPSDSTQVSLRVIPETKAEEALNDLLHDTGVEDVNISTKNELTITFQVPHQAE